MLTFWCQSPSRWHCYAKLFQVSTISLSEGLIYELSSNFRFRYNLDQYFCCLCFGMISARIGPFMLQLPQYLQQFYSILSRIHIRNFMALEFNEHRLSFNFAAVIANFEEIHAWERRRFWDYHIRLDNSASQLWEIFDNKSSRFASRRGILNL